jgi:two-component system, LytTR family, sensor kinase
MPRILRFVALWLGVASIFVVQNITRDLGRGRPVDWFGGVLGEILYWIPWILLTPVLLWAVRRFPIGRDALGRAIAAHLAVMLGIAVVQVPIADALQLSSFMVMDRLPPAGLAPLLRAMRVGFIPLVITACWKYWVFVGVYSAFDSARQLRDRELRGAQLERELATAQLQALRMQLHPHFLFNTLHSISMLNFVDVDAANRVLVQLSDLLRLTLDKSGLLEVPLAQEIDFLDRYLAIERMRFGDRLDVRLEVADDVTDASVPNLLLQPLVENAVRHGIAPYSRPGHLIVRARRSAAESRVRLVLEVEDDGPGLPPDWDVRADAGIGLANVRDRLTQGFGGACSLEFVRPPTHAGLLVRVTLPYRVAELEDTLTPARGVA